MAAGVVAVINHTRVDYTKDQYTAELIALYEDVVRRVYLKEINSPVAELAQEAWEHTTMSPLGYVVFIASPKMLTNRIERGQKAREKRWAKWLKEKSATDD